MSELITEEKMIDEPIVFKITIKRKEGGKDIIETRDVQVDTTSIHPGTAKELSERELDLRRLLISEEPQTGKREAHVWCRRAPRRSICRCRANPNGNP